MPQVPSTIMSRSFSESIMTIEDTRINIGCKCPHIEPQS